MNSRQRCIKPWEGPSDPRIAITVSKASIAGADGTETYFDTPQTARALQYWLRLPQLGVEPRGIVSWETLPTEFVAGRYAMIYHSTGSLTFIRSNASFKFGTAFMPVSRGTACGPWPERLGKTPRPLPAHRGRTSGCPG